MTQVALADLADNKTTGGGIDFVNIDNAQVSQRSVYFLAAIAQIMNPIQGNGVCNLNLYRNTHKPVVMVNVAPRLLPRWRQLERTKKQNLPMFRAESVRGG